MKKRVGVFMGGYSSEAEISRQSGKTVMDSLSAEAFEVYAVHINKEDWTVHQGAESWPLLRDSLSFFQNGETLKFDVIFNAIHGHPGEDGYLQALFELNKIPHSSSGFFESALTFNKHKTSTLLKNIGAYIPKSMLVTKGASIDPDAIVAEFGLPLFVKPNRSGSSFGVTKVKNVDEVLSALQAAFAEDHQAIVEQAITGTEVGCGVVIKNGKVEAIAVTEIVSKNDFFDYQAKYLGASDEITPARIDQTLYNEICYTSELIYKYLDLWGVSRVDYIIQDGKPYFIEVNTVPGLSPASIVPQQIAYRGWSLAAFFGGLLEETLLKNQQS